jgi:type 1 glutamine amidotransferase
MKALIVYGGWDGHTPKETSEVFERELKARGFEVRREASLAPLADEAALKDLDLIVPVWTMGELAKEQWKALNAAVRGGVGLAGVHGGMGDSFHACQEYQWMVGGQFVGHPHVGDYQVRLTDVVSPLTAGLPAIFPYKSEQYYMLVDPGNTVLADTMYELEGRRINMPVVWTRQWGRGRVFYSALGHVAQEFAAYPQVLEMTVRGMLWAAEGKSECCCA